MRHLATPTPDFVSTDAYQSVPLIVGAQNEQASKWLVSEAEHLSGNIKNTGANSITYRVVATNRPGTVADADKKIVVAEAAIAAGVVVHFEVPLIYYAYHEIQVKATVGGSQGAAQIDIEIKRIAD
jgi:hypothetical protein